MNPEAWDDPEPTFRISRVLLYSVLPLLALAKAVELACRWLLPTTPGRPLSATW